MDLQVIFRDGEPEYAVLPWAHYQALLKAAGISAGGSVPANASPPEQPAASSPIPLSDLPGFDQLGRLRIGKGVEAAQLARAVGISLSYLELIESGERLPDAAIRRSLAWELGVPGWRDEQ